MKCSPRSDARFTELFLAAEQFADRDIDAAYAFYVDVNNGSFVEINETIEPNVTGKAVRREFVPYDYEYKEGLYHLQRRDLESCNWLPFMGIEGFVSVKQVYNESPAWIRDMAQSLTDVEMPQQEDGPHSIFTDIANMHKILFRKLEIVHPNEIFVPEEFRQ